MAMVNAVLVFSFLTRAFYQILAMNQLYVLPDVPIQVGGDRVEIL